MRILTKTDGSPNEVSWTVKDDQGTILFSRNNFPSSNTVYIDTVFLSNGCYSITAYDSFGDGVCCYNGTGLFRILKGNTATVIGSSGDYGDFYNVNFAIDFQVGIDDVTDNEFFLYPNPTTGIIRINSSVANADSKLKVYNITGELVKLTDLKISGYNAIVDLSMLGNGLYFLQIDTDGKSVSRKVMISK